MGEARDRSERRLEREEEGKKITGEKAARKKGEGKRKRAAEAGDSSQRGVGLPRTGTLAAGKPNLASAGAAPSSGAVGVAAGQLLPPREASTGQCTRLARAFLPSLPRHRSLSCRVPASHSRLKKPQRRRHFARDTYRTCPPTPQRHPTLPRSTTLTRLLSSLDSRKLLRERERKKGRKGAAL